MPQPPKNLNVGDRIRVLRVPATDLKQRELEIASDSEMAGWTANSIERVIAENPIVMIWQIDAHGYPWYRVTLTNPDGKLEEHSLMVYDDGTWEKVDE